MDTIIESGMTFGPYRDEHCFYIEKSTTYTAIQMGVQMAEFLLLHDTGGSPHLWIVEAKSSSPRPESKEDFSAYIAAIRDKFANALGLGVASILKRHANAADELPDLFKCIDLASIGFRLVLVINGHKKEWLPPLQDALRRALHPTIRTWALGTNSVIVINEEKAKTIGLILAP